MGAVLVLLAAGSADAGERLERGALWTAAAADVVATDYLKRACARDPYCHGVGEHGPLAGLVVDERALGLKQVLPKIATTLVIDLAARELSKEGRKRERVADQLSAAGDELEAVKMRGSARGWRRAGKFVRIFGAAAWGGAAGWAAWQAR